MVEQVDLIRLNQVGVRYQTGTEALKDVSLSIKKGEFVFLVGSSGSGKSTFIKALLREVRTTSGELYVENKRVEKLKRREIPFYRRRIGVVFQEFRLLGDRNVFENVALAQRVIGIARKEKIKKNVCEMLKMVGLAGKEKAYPKELSGGEQQRVAIARAMVNRPSILLADEPTGNLDPENSWEIMRLLEEMNRLGTTVVVVTHNHEIVDQMKKRVVTVQKGRIVSDMMQGGYEV